MNIPVDHGAMPVCGWVEPWSDRAGATARLHLSSPDPAPRVRVIRLDRDDPPAQGWTVEPGPAPVKTRTLAQGSSIVLPLPAAIAAASAWHLRIELRLTRNASARPIIDLGPVRLLLDEVQHAVLRAGADISCSERSLPAENWFDIAVTATKASVAVTIDCIASSRPLAHLRLPLADGTAWAGEIHLGADRGRQMASLNARLGRITLGAEDKPLLSWRFPARGMPAAVPCGTADGPALRILNAPTFAVASARWDGTLLDPRVNPSHYDAIHLHDDDLAPLDWPPSFVAKAPEDASSGVYAFEVATAAGTERLPFFVRPRRPTARLAFLVPTLTYLAYADEYLPAERFPWACDDRGHRFAQANRLKSLYDIHEDGSGVSLASLRRPKATLRDDYRYPLSDSPHLLPVDLHFLKFCARSGIAIDLLTDHDLHREGVEALLPYAGIATGSHPEYWTSPMRAALTNYLNAGGNLAYLGGNGFYWVAAVEDDLMELRRGRIPAGRTWDGRPGEQHLALTGEPGGLWAERGRHECGLVGMGTTLMGFGPSRTYRRLEASSDPSWSWIFDGVGGEPIGPNGLVGGAAAGYEVDCIDFRRGTPSGIVRLAVAEEFDASFESDANDWFEGAAEERAATRRADMAIFRHEGGGLVFGVGSVAWLGALPSAGETNAVGHITGNILRGFEKALSRKSGANLGVGPEAGEA